MTATANTTSKLIRDLWTLSESFLCPPSYLRFMWQPKPLPSAFSPFLTHPLAIPLPTRASHLSSHRQMPFRFLPLLAVLPVLTSWWTPVWSSTSSRTQRSAPCWWGGPDLASPRGWCSPWSPLVSLPTCAWSWPWTAGCRLNRNLEICLKSGLTPLTVNSFSETGLGC